MTLDLLGIPEGEREFHDYPSIFSPARQPIIHIPTMRMRHGDEQTYASWWMARLDEIVEARQRERGIIHAVSYARRDVILSRTKHREIMMTHERDNLQSQLERFRSLPPPRYLVSPSIGTGYDFPHDQCRVQIIPKLPFPDTTHPLTKARVKSNEDYVSHVMVQVFSQMVGRIMRAPTDYGETFVTDDQIFWVKRLLPYWIRRLYRKYDKVPPPLVFPRETT
jgi:Rad3-related DNA helicase